MSQDSIIRPQLRLAVFVDFESLALGAAGLKGERFQIELVLGRLL